MVSATTGSYTLRTSIVARGAMKVRPMKARSGRTSAAARRRGRRLEVPMGALEVITRRESACGETLLD